MYLSRVLSRAACAIAMVGLFSAPLDARPVDPSIDFQARLADGEVVVGLENKGSIRYVTGTVIIPESPEKVWPIMTNPYEFKGRISPRMREIQMLVDKANLSVMKVHLDMSILFPDFSYTVESHYQAGERIEFHRVGGTLRDFKGSWDMKPIDGGTKTQLTYSMYVDPGFFVPQWIVREGVKGELPRTLKALRRRVHAVSEQEAQPESHTIAASNMHNCAIASSHQSVL